jgi:hypothetical protein
VLSKWAPVLRLVGTQYRIKIGNQDFRSILRFSFKGRFRSDGSGDPDSSRPGWQPSRTIRALDTLSQRLDPIQETDDNSQNEFFGPRDSPLEDAICPMQTCYLIVIGSGPAGQRTAIQAAKAGRKAAAVERLEQDNGDSRQPDLLTQLLQGLPGGGARLRIRPLRRDLKMLHRAGGIALAGHNGAQFELRVPKIGFQPSCRLQLR